MTEFTYKRLFLNSFGSRIEGKISGAMYEYKHLLHPFRLSILQLLYTNTKLASLDIKERLDLSWPDYYNSINALKKSELIQVGEYFDEDGLKRQFVVIKDKEEKNTVR